MSASHSPVSRLTATIAAARAAVLGHVQPPQEAPAGPSLGSKPTRAPLTPPRPAQRPTAPPVPRVLATLPTAAALRAGVRLTRGAARLHDLLVRLAGDVVRHRQHEVLPDALTFHLPAVGLAVFLGYTERHLARLAAELAEVGLIDFGAHAQRVAGRSMWDGTLWKVALTPTPAHAPRIRRDEWEHVWRPDFEADYIGKKGVKTELSGLLSAQDFQGGYQALRTRAAVLVSKNPPAGDRPDNSRMRGLDGIAAAVRGLAHVHHARRAAAITETAAALALALGEPERRAQWAGKLWEALRAHWEGRAGLDLLAVAAERLRADLVEGAPWRRPGAVLASRL